MYPVTYHIRANQPFRAPAPARRLQVPVQVPDEPGSYQADKLNEIKLDEPFKENSVLVLQPTGIDLESAIDSSPDAFFSILDNRGNSVFSLTISPSSGHVSFSSQGLKTHVTYPLEHVFPSESEHSLIVYKRKGQLRLLCDFTQFPEFSLATTLSPWGVKLVYFLGEESPLEGPITATVYSNITEFISGSPLYADQFPGIAGEVLYRQFQNFDLAHAGELSDTLSRVRRESELFDVSLNPNGHDAVPI